MIFEQLKWTNQNSNVIIFRSFLIIIISNPSLTYTVAMCPNTILAVLA